MTFAQTVCVQFSPASQMSAEIIDTVLNKLKEHKMEVPTFRHAAVATAEEHAAALTGSGLEGVALKNLVMKDKKGSLFLISIVATRQLNLKALPKLIVRTPEPAIIISHILII